MIESERSKKQSHLTRHMTDSAQPVDVQDLLALHQFNCTATLASNDATAHCMYHMIRKGPLLKVSKHLSVHGSQRTDDMFQVFVNPKCEKSSCACNHSSSANAKLIQVGRHTFSFSSFSQDSLCANDCAIQADIYGSPWQPCLATLLVHWPLLTVLAGFSWLFWTQAARAALPP